jgi:flagellar protein FlbT
MVNGARIENGDRKAKLCIKSEDARVLRLKDALRPEEAITPLKKAYYIAQLAVAGEIDNLEAVAILQSAIATLDEPTATSSNSNRHLETAREALASGRFYNVMRELGAMIKEMDAA